MLHYKPKKKTKKLWMAYKKYILLIVSHPFHPPNFSEAHKRKKRKKNLRIALTISKTLVVAEIIQKTRMKMKMKLILKAEN
jgi:hypothetical protein